jgi:hypothetical protein
VSRHIKTKMGKTDEGILLSPEGDVASSIRVVPKAILTLRMSEWSRRSRCSGVGRQRREIGGEIFVEARAGPFFPQNRGGIAPFIPR